MEATAIRKQRVLGIILARGGSKSIPSKNLADVCGKPLIAYTIEAALGASSLDRVVVSTDSPEIAEAARQFGVEVPFLRPSALAQDDTPGIEPLLHAVAWLEESSGYVPEAVMLLQPTSPLRTTDDMEAAVALFQERQADSVVSVCPIRHHPFWMKRITENGRLTDFIAQEQSYTRRQDLPPAYALNGAIFLSRTEVLVARKTFYTDQTYAYVMPAERSLDIDDPYDLYLLRLLLKDQQELGRD